MIEDGDDLTRRDYSAESWSGPPDGAVGWWKGRMPVAGAKKLVLAPDHVLVDLLRGLGDSTQRQPLRYLLALMLLRRRVLSIASQKVDHPLTVSRETTELKSQPDELEPIKFRVNADGSEIEVMPCSISSGKTEELEVALQELLYCEAPE